MLALDHDQSCVGYSIPSRMTVDTPESYAARHCLFVRWTLVPDPAPPPRSQAHTPAAHTKRLSWTGRRESCRGGFARVILPWHAHLWQIVE